VVVVRAMRIPVFPSKISILVVGLGIVIAKVVVGVG
jgi:hypothetical protein